MSSDNGAEVRNLAARAFWIGQGLPAQTAVALVDYGVINLEQLASLGRNMRLLIPDMGEVGAEAVEKLLQRRCRAARVTSTDSNEPDMKLTSREEP